MTNREKLIAAGHDDAIVLENPAYDEAIEGISEDGRVIYNYKQMVFCLVDDEGMTEEAASDFISYNTVRALPYMGPKAPIILYPLDEFV